MDTSVGDKTKKKKSNNNMMIVTTFQPFIKFLESFIP